MLRWLRQFLAVISAVLLVLGLVLQGRSMFLRGRDVVVWDAADGAYMAFVYQGGLVLEEYDLPPTHRGWAMGHWGPPGDSFAAESELATWHHWFPGVIGTPWTHFPAAGGYRILKVWLNLILLVLGMLPAIETGLWMRGLWRRRCAGSKKGLCGTCGYDLRAHQPGEKCPECGSVAGLNAGVA